MAVVRHCEIVCDVDKMPVDVQATIMKYKTIKQWAYIIHDKDDTRPHYHIYLNFMPSSCDTSMVANWFGIAENFVSKIKGRKVNMLEYLTHSNESQKHKYQYSEKDVTANFDFEIEIQNSKIIGNFKDYSYAQQLQYVNSLPIVEKTRAFSQLKKLWEVECQCLTLKTDRNMEVIFITGKGGTGKTTYAKRMLDKLGLDYCISSSSNDPFQDYLGQKAIILDDLRDKSFELEDLLKILDNNTLSSVKSRFNNKVFNGEMIVITSSVPINYWYANLKCLGSEDLNQFYRRINQYIIVHPTFISIYENGLNEDGFPIGKGYPIYNDLIQSFKKEKKKTDLISVFKELNETGV